jgi:hypothetical protein
MNNKIIDKYQMELYQALKNTDFKDFITNDYLVKFFKLKYNNVIDDYLVIIDDIINDRKYIIENKYHLKFDDDNEFIFDIKKIVLNDLYNEYEGHSFVTEYKNIINNI